MHLLRIGPLLFKQCVLVPSVKLTCTATAEAHAGLRGSARPVPRGVAGPWRLAGHRHRPASGGLDLTSPDVPRPCLVWLGFGAGGEGATVREILRHKSVEQVVMVDIDKVDKKRRWAGGSRVCGEGCAKGAGCEAERCSGAFSTHW